MARFGAGIALGSEDELLFGVYNIEDNNERYAQMKKWCHPFAISITLTSQTTSALRISERAGWRAGNLGSPDEQRDTIKSSLAKVMGQNQRIVVYPCFDVCDEMIFVQ